MRKRKPITEHLGREGVEPAEVSGHTAPSRPASHAPITLCDALDRVLVAGVAARGELAISVAGVDLVYLDARVLLASIDTAARAGAPLARELASKRDAGAHGKGGDGHDR